MSEGIAFRGEYYETPKAFAKKLNAVDDYGYPVTYHTGAKDDLTIAEIDKIAAYAKKEPVVDEALGQSLKMAVRAEDNKNSMHTMPADKVKVIMEHVSELPATDMAISEAMISKDGTGRIPAETLDGESVELISDYYEKKLQHFEAGSDLTADVVAPIMMELTQKVDEVTLKVQQRKQNVA
jgi:hypothetical protein